MMFFDDAFWLTFQLICYMYKYSQPSMLPGRAQRLTRPKRGILTTITHEFKNFLIHFKARNAMKNDRTIEFSLHTSRGPAYSDVGRLTLTYSDVFKRIQTYADLRWRIETYADALLHSTIRCIWGVRKSPPYGRAQRLTPSKCTFLGKIIQNFKKKFDRFYWEERNERWGHHRRITSHEGEEMVANPLPPESMLKT